MSAHCAAHCFHRIRYFTAHLPTTRCLIQLKHAAQALGYALR